MTKTMKYARYCWRLASLAEENFEAWYISNARAFSNMASVLMTQDLVKRMQEWESAIRFA